MCVYKHFFSKSDITKMTSINVYHLISDLKIIKTSFLSFYSTCLEQHVSEFKLPLIRVSESTFMIQKKIVLSSFRNL